MSEIRLAVVNGTGPAGHVYDELMQTSFCWQLGQKLGAKAFYHRGPQLLGHEVHEEAVAVHHWLKKGYEADPTTRLMLAGYSRGGSAAIMACEMLEKDRIPVDSLFLFDAVARHEFRGGTVIPANVRFSRHARRCHDAEFVAKYRGALAHHGLLGGFQNPIRPSFGNTGLTWRGDGDHAPAEAFLGSHGALGGVGWRFVTEDNDCEHAAAAWMREQMSSRGLDVELEAFAPVSGADHVTDPSAFHKWLTHNVFDFAQHHDRHVFHHAAEAELAQLQAQTVHARALVGLFKALGGGWAARLSSS